MPYVTSTPSNGILPDIKLTEFDVIEMLCHLDPKKVCGPDCIPSRLLLELTDVIAPSLSSLFKMFLSLGVVRAQWKHANITPVFKKDDPALCVYTTDRFRFFACCPKFWNVGFIFITPPAVGEAEF